MKVIKDILLIIMIIIIGLAIGILAGLSDDGTQPNNGRLNHYMEYRLLFH